MCQTHRNDAGSDDLLGIELVAVDGLVRVVRGFVCFIGLVVFIRRLRTRTQQVAKEASSTSKKSNDQPLSRARRSFDP